MKKDKKNIRNNDIIQTDIVSGSYEKSVKEIEDVILATDGADIEKLQTFIFLLCDSNEDHYNKTIDLLTMIEDFKNKLEE